MIFEIALIIFRDAKQNKGTILRASVDYIKILRRQYDNASLIDGKCQMLAEQNFALQERVKVRIKHLTIIYSMKSLCLHLGIGKKMFIEWYSNQSIINYREKFAGNCHGPFEYCETRTIIIIIFIK